MSRQQCFLFRVIYKHFPEHLAVMSWAILLPETECICIYCGNLFLIKLLWSIFIPLLCYIKNIRCISNVFYSKLKGSRSQPTTVLGGWRIMMGWGGMLRENPAIFSEALGVSSARCLNQAAGGSWPRAPHVSGRSQDASTPDYKSHWRTKWKKGGIMCTERVCVYWLCVRVRAHTHVCSNPQILKFACSSLLSPRICSQSQRFQNWPLFWFLRKAHRESGFYIHN